MLSDEQRGFYLVNGYLVVPDLVPEPFFAGVQHVLEGRVEEKISEWHAAGLIQDTYVDLEFGSRYHVAWLSAGRPRPATTDDTHFFEQARPFLEQSWIVGLVAEAVRAERVAALNSSFYRAKFPDDETTTLPWHQDAPCVSPVSDVNFITVWLPLVDVSENNSCLEVSPLAQDQLFEPTLSERSGYVCMRASDADNLTEPRPIRMRRGDVLLLSPYIPHRSLDNTSGWTRWSLDLRYSLA